MVNLNGKYHHMVNISVKCINACVKVKVNSASHTALQVLHTDLAQLSS